MWYIIGSQIDGSAGSRLKIYIDRKIEMENLAVTRNNMIQTTKHMVRLAVGDKESRDEIVLMLDELNSLIKNEIRAIKEAKKETKDEKILRLIDELNQAVEDDNDPLINALAMDISMLRPSREMIRLIGTDTWMLITTIRAAMLA